MNAGVSLLVRSHKMMPLYCLAKVLGYRGCRNIFIVSYTFCINGCFLAIIPVRLSDDEVKQIDLLAKRGGRSSRSKVIREILQEHLAQKLSDDQDVTDLVEALIKIGSKGREPVKLHFQKTVTEAVSEGRA